MSEDLQFLDIADRFLRFVSRETGLPVIICDRTGTIVKAVVRSRIGTKHAGAQRIMRGEAAEYVVTAEEAAANPLVKEGCNYPIEVDGVRVGTFGIAGDLTVVKPVARLASHVMASWIKEDRQRRALHEAAQGAGATVAEVTERMGKLRERARGVGAAMAAASSAAGEQVARTDGVVRTVDEIAQQTRILSINGSVEATRAGEHGRAFAVVSREMLDLAEHARTAATEIRSTLGQVRASIDRVGAAVTESSAISTEQANTLSRTAEAVEALQRVIAGLAASFESQGNAGGDAGARALRAPR
jgi:sugar diacid utilization regulator